MRAEMHCHLVQSVSSFRPNSLREGPAPFVQSPVVQFVAGKRLSAELSIVWLEELMHALIIANGAVSDYTQCRHLADAANIIIAADGGAHHAAAAGLVPDVIIGDLDSLSGETVSQLRSAGATVINYPPRKDQTDLELALRHAVRQGATHITIVGALGGRLDQAVANLLLLTLPELLEIEVRLVDGASQAWVVHDYTQINGRPGDTVSLIPLTDQVTGITTAGLEYPLRDGTLYLGRTRGVSNMLTTSIGEVRVGSGLLLVVQCADL